jgi:hypothetical protein
MNLRIGILIIGSLWWHPHKTREDWRNDRLRKDDAVPVRVPIRYGRLSKSNTYTMVFSASALPGYAKVVPCRTNVTSDQDLFEEATNLWAAEAKLNSNNQISASWGCVVVCVNPHRAIPPEILASWKTRVSEDPNVHDHYAKFTHPANEVNLVSDSGLLQIAWPKRTDDTELDFDLLLATANYPFEPGAPCPYPTPREIAGAWLKYPEEVTYFNRNCADGFRTFEDDAIVQILSPV